MPHKDLPRRAAKILALLTGLALLLVQLPAGAADDSQVGGDGGSSAPQQRVDNWFELDSNGRQLTRSLNLDQGRPISWTPDFDALSRTLKSTPQVDAPVVSVPPRAPSASVPSSPASTKGPVFQSHIPFTSSEVPNTTDYPNVIHGRVVLGFNGGTGFCSGTAVTSNNASVVITAAHCLMDPGTGETPKTIDFLPGFRLGAKPFGTWPAVAFGVTSEWAQSVSQGSADPRYDVGTFVVAPDSGGQRIGDLLGTRGIIFNQAPNQLFDSFGYPTAAPFDGQRLWLCDSETSDLLTLVPAPQPHGIGCDMTPGSSGGGWVLPSEQVNSVNSFKLVDHPNVMYGPQFGSSAQSLYNQASNYDPNATPTRHKMTVSLKLSGHLVASGVMKSKDGYKPCTRKAPIKLFRKKLSSSKRPTGGKVVKRTQTSRRGKYRMNVPDKPGFYYIKSPAGFVDSANDCSAAKSVVRAHRH